MENIILGPMKHLVVSFTLADSLTTTIFGESLQDAFAHVSKTYFPPSGTVPDPLLFTAPQYNTWIELIYEQTQKGITDYTNAIVKIFKDR